MHLSKRLLAVQMMSQHGVISKNMGGILKNQLIRGDENLNFIFNQFETKEAYTLERFLNQINSFVEKEIEHTYNQLFSECSLQDAKVMSKRDREHTTMPLPPPSTDSEINENADVTSDNRDLPAPPAVKRHEMSLTYGEIEYKSFYDILRKLDIPSSPCVQPVPVPVVDKDAAAVSVVGKYARKNDNGLVFYDLGHGTGRAVFVANLMHDFKCCKGIELLDSLYKASVDVHAKFKQLQHMQPRSNGHGSDGCGVELIHGSIVDNLVSNGSDSGVEVNWWEDGDVIFANSTCFDATLMEQVSLCAQRCKPGAILITFTKSLNYTYSAGMGTGTSASAVLREGRGGGITNNAGAVSEAYRDEYSFELLDKLRYRMSWGPATVYIHRKLESATLLPPIVNESVYAFSHWKKCLLENRGDEDKIREILGGVAKTGVPADSDGQLQPSAKPKRSIVKGSKAGSTVSDDSQTTADEVSGDEVEAVTDTEFTLTPANVVSGGYLDSVHTDPVLGGGTTMGGKQLPQSLKYSLYAPCNYSSTNYSDFNVVVFLHGANGRGKSFEFCKTQGLLKHLAVTVAGSSGASPVSPCSGSDKDDDWEMLYGPTADGVSVLSEDGVSVSNATSPVGVGTGGVSAKTAAMATMERNKSIVLAPICPSGFEWKHEHICKLVISLLDHVLSSLFINAGSKPASGVYLTGYSMGGLGCWMLSSRYRNRFRAVVPICGGGNPVYACLLASMPM